MKRIPDPEKMRRIRGPVIGKGGTAAAKIRVTTCLDDDVIESLRDMAEKSGGKYQTVLNRVLRDYLFGEKKGVLARLERLEKAVFRNLAA